MIRHIDKRRLSITAMIVAAACAMFAGGTCAAEKKAARPNIVLILCDDLGFSDLGCYGGEIRTPNLDRLAAEGLRFTQFYNCAVCYTTRAALMTGLHPRYGAGGLLRRNMVTIAEVLGRAGYRVSLTGKWHLGGGSDRHPSDRGFEEFYGLLSGCCNYFNPAKRDPTFEGSGFRHFTHNKNRLREFPDDFYTTDAFTDHAIEQIRRFAGKGKPFFVHVCYTAPHFPLHAKPEDIARYKGKYRMGYYELRRQRHRRQLEMGLLESRWKLSPVDKKIGPWRHDWKIDAWEDVKNRARELRRMEVYAAMVDSMDQGIGRIMEALEETGADDNTLVMFLSDNGGCATDTESKDPNSPHNRELPGDVDTYSSCGPGWGWAQCTPLRRYKVWTYEGGIITPMIARWPGAIRPGTITRQVGHVVDFMPTCIELAGTEYPEKFNERPILPVEGKSFLPILQGKQREGHQTLCWFLAGNRAIRQGKWKLVWGHTGRKWELYDMQADRTETNDLAGQYPQRAKQMIADWHAWAEQTEVPSAKWDDK